MLEKIDFKRRSVDEDNFLNALAEAYRLQESIISTTDLSIISTNPEGVITSFNRAAEKLTGYSAEEMIGKAKPIVLHDPIQVLERAHVLSVQEGREINPGFDVLAVDARASRPDKREWTYIRKGGTRVPVSLSITALWDDNHNLIGYAAIGSDITSAKDAEQQIRDSELHLQTLLNSIDDVAIEVSREGVYTNVWTRKDYLLLTSREELIGKRLEDVLAGDTLVQYKEAIAKVLRTRGSEYIEYLIPGSDRWSAGKFSYINPERVLVLIRNITEKKKAEILLAQSEQKFRTLAENIPGAIYLCRNDDQFSMLYLNEKVEEITGYQAEDFLANRIAFPDLYHPDDRDHIYAVVDSALERREKFHLKYRIKHKDGGWRWVDEVGIGVYTDQHLDLIEGFISDITLQKKAEEELQKVAEENYRLFNSPVALNVVAGTDGFFKRINPAWISDFGWTETELTSKPFLEFVHPEDRARTVAIFEKMLDGTNVNSFENRYRCKDGTYRSLLWGATRDFRHDLVFASAIDITERKKSEDELLRSKQNIEAIAHKLQEQNRQLDEFAHIISHNLRSPIGNIKALIGLLGPSSSIAEYQQIFEKLQRVSHNLGETMSELMETLRARKETDIERQELRFKEVFDKVVQTLEGDLIHSEAHLTFNFDDAPVINYSKGYLESILQNLLSNAIKYRSPDRKPEILIQTTAQDGNIVLQVSDNGLGIDMERFGDKLFGLHKTFHEHQDARGVGLFLVKTQIEAMGGTIGAESEIDKGTTFTIRF